jgi:SNF2 family DNA or RNA helicase
MTSDWNEAVVDLQRDVHEHGGFLTMQRDTLRERFAIGRLTEGISQELLTMLQEHGLGEGEVPDENAAGAVGGATAKGKKGNQSLIIGEAKLVDGLLARLETLRGPDSKLDGFASGLKKLVERAPSMKVLIFTEYRATQEGLTSKLADLFGKESVDTIHGSKRLDERKEVVRRFNELDQPRFIVSTAAGGEGLNLQRRCHTIVNYDLPWNPNVLQQRIGRVYRYGQTKPVVVYNLKVIPTATHTPTTRSTST